MTDPKLLLAIAIGVIVVGDFAYSAWENGWLSGWKLPIFSKPSTPEIAAAEAFAAAELLVRYYEKRQCLEGSRDAKAAASHLLDCPTTNT